jgi:hypothetical protein
VNYEFGHIAPPEGGYESVETGPDNLRVGAGAVVVLVDGHIHAREAVGCKLAAAFNLPINADPLLGPVEARSGVYGYLREHVAIIIMASTT